MNAAKHEEILEDNLLQMQEIYHLGKEFLSNMREQVSMWPKPKLE